MDTDVLIIGAGTSGAAAARACAKRGLRVICIDRGPLERAGAHWVNGVSLSAFDRAGVARPEGAELHSSGHAFHMIAGFAGPRVVMRDHGIGEVDMRLLVARLQREAREAGAEFRAHVHAQSLGAHNTVQTSDGAIRAKFIIDASGIGGAGLVQTPRVDRLHLCAAAQRVHHVRNRRGAQQFFEANGGALGELLCFTSVAGGYSIVNVRADDEHVSILTGSIPARGFPSGQKLIDDFVREQDWIGDEVFGGARAIPLRRPFDRLVYGPLALLGDSGCQVFSAHGSGIGSGLYAARLLADTLASGGSLEDWATKWMREVGGMHAAYDLFRRFSATLSTHDVSELIAHGILSEPLALAGLQQRMPVFDARTLARLGAGLTRVPALGARLAANAARMQALVGLYRVYPRDPSARRAWAHAVAAMFSESPDPT